MSRILRDIPTSCPMFDKAIAELDYIERLVEPDVWNDIKKEISAAKDYIEECRSINGQLRDTCSDIADGKNGEISELNEEIEKICAEHESEVDNLQNEIYRLQDLTIRYELHRK